ncbi:DNA/RNA non-specific endonuclease [Microbacterium sp. CFBP9034]|uniref:DNA/RNA non-specific endonuclease n=1 Tax=Microbacterium sp. CFBP9034 TaxID=3096540 RepID=UPI002A6AB854|nr:DNA/RNA non-specific endonuclease [Microbacterium sp. CFBP9034]MDY0909218.1 DNA/RNA non-specific endonuclease [Microbacterium sp. CFBP9034]
MTEELLAALAAEPWALPLLFALVLGDAFLVVIPGEAAVTAYGALSASTGSPPLPAVILVAASAAALGDGCCYLVGRTVGLDRWAWMRTPSVRSAFAWARARLDRRIGTVVFTARFIPFARLAVNLVAGASRVPAPRYAAVVVLAALAWAAYQALIGALVARILPGGPAVAVVASIVVAVGVGVALDAVLARAQRRRGQPMPPDVARPRQDGAMSDATPTGYDEAFLGIPLPLPRPLGDSTMRELPYARFTVLLDPQRRLAAVTAVNIDGATLQDLPRTGDWELDPRAPASEQTGAAVYASNDLDRGHLVRRRDPGWGTVAEARAATEATFSYTNAAPQAAGFNQSKELWLGLEDHVLGYADTTDQRLSVVTAPVLAPDDPPYRGILIPRRFFKVAAWAADGDGATRLRAAGFVLDQSEIIDTSLGALAAPPLGGFRTFQVPIGDIEALAGIDLGALVEADVLPTTTVRGQDAWRPVRAPEDVVLG